MVVLAQTNARRTLNPMEELIPFGADADAVQSVDPDELDTVGFHPTFRRPFPSVQCRGAIRQGERAGEQCGRRATLGSYLCVVHGAQLPNNKKMATRNVENARILLLTSGEDLVDLLIDLARNANSEAVKLGAINSALDRAGIKGGQDVNITVSAGESPHDVLAERLTKLRSRVVEGVVVQTATEVGDTVIPEEDSLHRAEEQE